MPIKRDEVAPPEAWFDELRSGNLGVRLAVTAAEIDAVQALRYRVFYQELGARADAATAASHRDRDDFDAIADHLLVVDHDRGEGPELVVGTYRLIRREGAESLGVGIPKVNMTSPAWWPIPHRCWNWGGLAWMRPIVAVAPCNYCGTVSRPMSSALILRSCSAALPCLALIWMHSLIN